MSSSEDIKKILANITTLSANMAEGFDKAKQDMTELKIDMKNLVLEAIKPTNEKVEFLEAKLREKDKQLHDIRRDFESLKRKNNIVLFNIPEKENNFLELQEIVISIMKKVPTMSFSNNDLNDIYRLGKKGSQNRPILVSLTSQLKVKTILAHKYLFKNENIVVSQDFQKEVNLERKRLQPMVTAINQSGIKAFLKGDQLFVNGKKIEKEIVESQLELFMKSMEEDKETNNKRKLERSPAGNNAKKSTNNSLVSFSNNERNSTPPNSQQNSSKHFKVFDMHNKTTKNVLSPLSNTEKTGFEFNFNK